MKWAIAGTPGTGKTSASDALDRQVIHLSNVLEEEQFQRGFDADRETMIADVDALSEWIDEREDDIIVESHLAHVLPVNRVIVLRCHPGALRRRLEGRTHPGPTGIDENVEAERLDVILTEAVEQHGEENVFEIDTTDRDPREVADRIEAVLDGSYRPKPGSVSFLQES